MSNLIRRVQRRRPGLGDRLGVHNELAKDLIARQIRETIRLAKKEK